MTLPQFSSYFILRPVGKNPNSQTCKTQEKVRKRNGFSRLSSVIVLFFFHCKSSTLLFFSEESCTRHIGLWDAILEAWSPFVSCYSACMRSYLVSRHSIRDNSQRDRWKLQLHSGNSYCWFQSTKSPQHSPLPPPHSIHLFSFQGAHESSHMMNNPFVIFLPVGYRSQETGTNQQVQTARIWRGDVGKCPRVWRGVHAETGSPYSTFYMKYLYTNRYRCTWIQIAALTNFKQASYKIVSMQKLLVHEKY